MTANKDEPKLIRTALDYSRKSLDAEERRFISRIREHGWTGTYVQGEEGGLPNFYYTTGLWLSTGFPELLVFFMEMEQAHRVAWRLHENVVAGKPPEIGVPAIPMLGCRFGFLVPVDEADRNEFLTWSHWFYQRKQFEAVQLYWTDEDEFVHADVESGIVGSSGAATAVRDT